MSAPLCATDPKHGTATWRQRGICITEGIGGAWYYHLSRVNSQTRSFCGKQTMFSPAPLDTWGQVGHLKERYCSTCERLANDAVASVKTLGGGKHTSKAR